MGTDPACPLRRAGELPGTVAQTGVEFSLLPVLKATPVCAREMGLKPLDSAECQILEGYLPRNPPWCRRVSGQ